MMPFHPRTSLPCKDLAAEGHCVSWSCQDWGAQPSKGARIGVMGSLGLFPRVSCGLGIRLAKVSGGVTV